LDHRGEILARDEMVIMTVDLSRSRRARRHRNREANIAMITKKASCHRGFPRARGRGKHDQDSVSVVRINHQGCPAVVPGLARKFHRLLLPRLSALGPARSSPASDGGSALGNKQGPGMMKKR